MVSLTSFFHLLNVSVVHSALGYCFLTFPSGPAHRFQVCPGVPTPISTAWAHTAVTSDLNYCATRYLVPHSLLPRPVLWGRGDLYKIPKIMYLFAHSSDFSPSPSGYISSSSVSGVHLWLTGLSLASHQSLSDPSAALYRAMLNYWNIWNVPRSFLPLHFCRSCPLSGSFSSSFSGQLPLTL